MNLTGLSLRYGVLLFISPGDSCSIGGIPQGTVSWRDGMLQQRRTPCIAYGKCIATEMLRSLYGKCLFSGEARTMLSFIFEFYISHFHILPSLEFQIQPIILHTSTHFVRLGMLDTERHCYESEIWMQIVFRLNLFHVATLWMVMSFNPHDSPWAGSCFNLNLTRPWDSEKLGSLLYLENLFKIQAPTYFDVGIPL